MLIWGLVKAVADDGAELLSSGPWWAMLRRGQESDSVEDDSDDMKEINLKKSLNLMSSELSKLASQEQSIGLIEGVKQSHTKWWRQKDNRTGEERG